MNIEKFKLTELKSFSSRDQIDFLNYIESSKEELRVTIFQSDETGQSLWIVAFEDWKSFWLNGFHTEPQAQAFCSKYDLKISKEEICEL